jgi:hypothetical protein
MLLQAGGKCRPVGLAAQGRGQPAMKGVQKVFRRFGTCWAFAPGLGGY